MEENDEPTAPGKSCSIFQSSSIQTTVESKHELHVDELDIHYTLLHFFIHFGLCRQNILTSIFLPFSSAEVAVWQIQSSVIFENHQANKIQARMAKIWVVVLPDCERRRLSQKIGVPKRIRWNNELFQNFIFTDGSSIWLNRQ